MLQAKGACDTFKRLAVACCKSRTHQGSRAWHRGQLHVAAGQPCVPRPCMRKLACWYLVLLQGHGLIPQGESESTPNCSTFQVWLVEWLPQPMSLHVHGLP